MVFIPGFHDRLVAIMPERRPQGERGVGLFPWCTGRYREKPDFAAVRERISAAK
jgi:hypothetical protein